MEFRSLCFIPLFIGPRPRFLTLLLVDWICPNKREFLINVHTAEADGFYGGPSAYTEVFAGESKRTDCWSLGTCAIPELIYRVRDARAPIQRLLWSVSVIGVLYGLRYVYGLFKWRTSTEEGTAVFNGQEFPFGFSIILILRAIYHGIDNCDFLDVHGIVFTYTRINT